MGLSIFLGVLKCFQITGSRSTGDTTDLGWVRPGDPRADLLLTISQQGIAMPVLLNGLSEFRSHGKPADLLAPPSPSTIRSISPLARVLQGEYDVPTFIVDGTEDEGAPFASAKRFVDAQRLRNPAIACEFLAVPGAKHSKVCLIWD
jgi:hypothetical protein